MRLWIESAHESLPGPAGEAPSQTTPDSAGNWVRTLTTEDRFLALFLDVPATSRDFVAAPTEGYDAGRGAFGGVLDALERGEPLDAVAEDLLAALPGDLHLPLAILQVREGRRASLLECDAPPLFMTREGRLVLLPVVEEERGSRLIRRCEFGLLDGDHLAMVGETFLRGVRWDRRWGWRDIAAATRRLTETRCDAGQLAGALIRQYQRGVTRDQEPGTGDDAFAIRHRLSATGVLAMFVRSMRSVTVWSGPPASRSAEHEMLDRLKAEEDVRVICGDTTAEIAARLLGAQLVMEPRPADGWREVPPASRMVGPAGMELVDLVTEGVVTMTVARERLASVQRFSRQQREALRDLAARGDGASRLAQVLLAADKVRFLVGGAVNPAQTAPDGTPLRRIAVDALIADLRARGKIVQVEYF
jgi:hypothetical protein